MNKSSTPSTKASEGFQPYENPEIPYNMISEGKRKTYSCNFPDCGKIFRYKSEMARHVATHQSLRPFVCPHERCQKGFKREDALENHVRTHTKEAPFECKLQDCGKKFTTKASLRYHILKHRDEKVHKCTFSDCDKAFITIFQRKQHEKSSHNKVSNDEPKPIANPRLRVPREDNSQDNTGETEIPVFEANESANYDNKMTINDNNIVISNPQMAFGERILEIISENSELKRKLEFSNNIINFLQQRIQFDNTQVSDFKPEIIAENFKKFAFYNNTDG